MISGPPGSPPAGWATRLQCRPVQWHSQAQRNKADGLACDVGRAKGGSSGRKWGTGQGGEKRGRPGLWGVECTLAVIGTGGPARRTFDEGAENVADVEEAEELVRRGVHHRRRHDAVHGQPLQSQSHSHTVTQSHSHSHSHGHTHTAHTAHTATQPTQHTVTVTRSHGHSHTVSQSQSQSQSRSILHGRVSRRAARAMAVLTTQLFFARTQELTGRLYLPMSLKNSAC
eukprot:1114881-Prorocentrum_minimum.AAC.1